MRERIPTSELVVFEQSGHFAHVEEPEAFFDAVRGWLRRT
jgi:pimeloyl-ACP methyl ester carboxylesterase